MIESIRARVRPTAVGAHVPDEPIRVRPPHRATPLAWRKRDSDEGLVFAGDGTKHSRARVGVAVGVAPNATSIDESQATRVAAQVRSPVAAPLDATMVARLTDDVMERIERRVRIERERRGL